MVLFTSSCASDNPSSVDMTGRSQIEDDEVLLVGKVSVVPVPATKTSQETDTLNLFSDERVLLWLSPFKRNVKSQPDDMLGLSAAWGKTFSYAIPKKNVALQKLERAKAVNDQPVYLPLLLPEAFKFLIR
ncbi:hypothetical protein ATN88_22140 [Enterovibrio coralii]|uniref:Uncharacterized protein n=1 Tax=Enterovibrio coralii TaxID=294935 RepID=A0A135I4T2_9GAMM|nr:hypothetical protein ATN88_22140 [Enterovibrio coralii]